VQVLEETVVVANVEDGYWASSVASSYPNPMFIKMMRYMCVVLLQL
jgi:hypothetical protein